MTLEELAKESLPKHGVESDPCRLLPASTLSPYRETGREVIHYPGGTVSIILVEDEETGLVTRQFKRVDGHLGSVSDDC